MCKKCDVGVEAIEINCERYTRFKISLPNKHATDGFFRCGFFYYLSWEIFFFWKVNAFKGHTTDFNSL